MFLGTSQFSLWYKRAGIWKEAWETERGNAWVWKRLNLLAAVKVSGNARDLLSFRFSGSPQSQTEAGMSPCVMIGMKLQEPMARFNIDRK